jgi:hypothetical protein
MCIQLEPKWVLLCLCSAGGEPPDVVLLRRIGLDHIEGAVYTWANGGVDTECANLCVLVRGAVSWCFGAGVPLRHALEQKTLSHEQCRAFVDRVAVPAVENHTLRQRPWSGNALTRIVQQSVHRAAAIEARRGKWCTCWGSRCGTFWGVSGHPGALKSSGSGLAVASRTGCKCRDVWGGCGTPATLLRVEALAGALCFALAVCRLSTRKKTPRSPSGRHLRVLFRALPRRTVAAKQALCGGRDAIRMNVGGHRLNVSNVCCSSPCALQCIHNAHASAASFLWKAGGPEAAVDPRRAQEGRLASELCVDHRRAQEGRLAFELCVDFQQVQDGAGGAMSAEEPGGLAVSCSFFQCPRGLESVAPSW